MAINQLIPAFNAGELSPYLDARSDLEKYASGCRWLENFIIMPYGGIYRRPGTEYLGVAKYPNKLCRLLGFNFSTTTRFVIEVGDLYIRFWSNGVQVQVSGSPLEVSSPYYETEVRELQFVQINDVMYFTHPQHPPYKLSRLADDNWTFEVVEWDWPTVLDDNVTPITIAASATTGTGITLTASTAAWVTATAYKKGDFVLTGGVIYKALANHASAAAFATDLAANRWEEFNVFDVGNVGGYFQIGHNRATNFIERAISSNGSSASNLIVLGDWEFNTYGTWNATVHIERSYDNGANWDIIRTYDSNSDKNVASSGKEDRQALLRIRVANYATNTAARALLTAQDAKVYGFVKITGFTSSISVTADVKKDLFATTATAFWAEGAWSPLQGYPRAIAIHEQRMFYGGTSSRPQSIWGSVTDDFENFRLSTNDDGGLFFTLASQQANPVQWILAKDSLIIGTAGDEWTLGGSDSDSAITPTSVKAICRGSFGSKSLRAIVVNNVILFVQRQGRKVRELVYSFETDGYNAPDLTMLSEHVTKGEILECAYQQQPDAIYWTITGAGQLVGMTYERDQNVVGWHRHTTQGSFESVATIYGANDEPDEVWLAVKRTINGQDVRCIERFRTDYRTAFEEEIKPDWWYLDCAKRVELTTASKTVSGFSHLNGMAVDILSDGAVSPSRTVTGGQVTLPDAGKKVLVGLGYISTMRTMKLEAMLQTGSTRGKKKRIHRLTACIYKSLGGEFSSNGREWDSFYSRDMVDEMDDSPPPFTGDKDVYVAGDTTMSADVSIRQDQPLPLTILAVVPEWDAYGA